jgi:hypothetical protein
MQTENEDGAGPVEIAPASVRRAIFILAVAGLALLALFLVGGIVTQTLRKDAVYLSILVAHYPATIGLPIAALAALVLVYVLEYSRGPIEFEGLGFKFKGAAGPLAFWIACFLAINLSIFALWTREFHSPVADKVLEDLVSDQILAAQLDRAAERCFQEARLRGQVGNEPEVKKVCADRLESLARRYGP